MVTSFAVSLLPTRPRMSESLSTRFTSFRFGIDTAPDHAWLVRVSKLGYPKHLVDLMSSGEVIKVGSGLKDDLRRMRSDFHFKPGGFLDLQNYVEAFQIGEKGLKKLSAIILGRRISKSQQVSNWDADNLTEAQLRYAATDAWICLEIYNELRNVLSNQHE